MNKAGIIGLGRFGTLLKQILSPEIDVIGYDPKQVDSHSLDQVLQQKTLFIASPIREFEKIIRHIAAKLKPNTTVIDVCSVKIFPVKVMTTHLPSYVDIIASHPLFGPDSYHIKDNKIMFASIRDQYQNYLFWKQFFIEKKFLIEEMTPEQHDRIMASSQGITHLLGRALKEINASTTPLNTTGYEQLLSIMDHTCNDSWDLFYDLQKYNPYSKTVNQKFVNIIQKITKTIP